MRLFHPSDVPHNILAGVAIVALVGSLGLLFLPKPTTKGMKTKFDRSAKLAKAATKSANQRTAELEGQNAIQVWSSNAEDIAPIALAKVSALATQQKLKLIAFRPQRLNPAGALDQLPFLVTVDGTFPQVVAFERELEKTETKLAVNLFQLASADAASDRVTASIGLVAYLQPGVPKASVPAQKAPEVKSSAAKAADPKGEKRG